MAEVLVCAEVSTMMADPLRDSRASDISLTVLALIDLGS
jgi:hypothetical protein